MAATAVGAAKAAARAVQEPLVLAGRVVMYDGLCNLCNAGVRFVAKRDPNRRIMFCSVQSRAAEPYLRGVGLTRQDVLRRFIFIEYRDWSAASTAALRLTKHMRMPWPAAQALLVVPVPLRDAVYDLVAANRYRLFGRTQYCQIPDPAILDRFVDRDELIKGLCSNEAMLEEEEGDGDDSDKGAGKGGGGGSGGSRG